MRTALPDPAEKEAELEAAETPGYTVPEWAAIPTARLRIVDEEVAVHLGNFGTTDAESAHTGGVDQFP